MPTITCFEDIEAWKTAQELTKIDYLETHPQSRRVREEGPAYES